MEKKLPKVYANKIDKDVKNNKRVYYSSFDEKKEDVRSTATVDRNRPNLDGKTVAAVDLEVPGAGELMGGSQREENYDKLVARMKEMNMDTSSMDWYLNFRKYGGCIHSGFGMGFERLLIYLTGVDNIRDVIPYPRTPKNCEF